MPLLALAIASSQNDTDLYPYQADSGASLAKSLQFLVPFCTGAQTHAEFVNSKVGFDKKRAESGEVHYQAGRLFEPLSGAPVFELAAVFDPSFLPVYFKAKGEAQTKFASWQLVLNAARAEKK